MNLRDIIIAADDLHREPVAVPEWKDPATGEPVTVYVSTMTGTTRAKWAAVAFDADGKVIDANVRGRLLVYCLVDADGKPLFTPDDVEAIEGKNRDVVTRLFDHAKRLNGLDPAQQDAAEKNSPDGGTNTSGTSSPSPSAEA